MGFTLTAPGDVDNVVLWVDASQTDYTHDDGTNVHSVSNLAHMITPFDYTKQDGSVAVPMKYSLAARVPGKSTAINSLDTFSFVESGSADEILYFAVDSSLLATDLSVAIVWQAASSFTNGGHHTAFNLGQLGPRLIVRDSTNDAISLWDNTNGWFYSAVEPTVSTDYIIIFTFDENNERVIKINGATAETDAVTTNPASGNNIDIGNGTGAKYVSNNQSAGGHIGEVIVCNDLWSGAEITAIETYLNDKWDVY